MQYMLRVTLVCSCLFFGYVIADDNEFRGWTPAGSAIWKFTNNELIGKGGDGFLVSSRTYEEFELSVDFWISTATAP